MPQLSKSLWEAIGGVIIPMAIVPSNLLLVLVNTKIKLLATCYYILYCKGLWYELLQAVNIEWSFLFIAASFFDSLFLVSYHPSSFPHRLILKAIASSQGYSFHVASIFSPFWII